MKKQDNKPMYPNNEGLIYYAAILDRRRENKESMYPIRYRVTHKRKQVYYNSGYSCTLEDWETLETSKSHEKSKLRKSIKDGLTVIEDYVFELKNDFSFEALNNCMGRGKKTDLIADAFETKINELKKKGQVGTASIYNSAKLMFLSYKPNLKFKDVTPKFLELFESFAKTKIRYATLGMYLRCLRSLFNKAIGDGEIPASSYPFSKNQNDKKYKIKAGTGTKIALSVDQLAKFIQYEPLFEAQQRHKDLFLLSFHLGGINIKDLLLLRWENLKQGELVYIREKTARTSAKEIEIKTPLNNEAKAIIERWGNTDKRPKARILPYMPDGATPELIRKVTLNVVRNLNRDLYKISDKLEIDGLSSMVARHSIATLMKNNKVSESFIKEMLGHTDIKTTQNYLKSFESEQRKETFNMIENVINKAVNKG